MTAVGWIIFALGCATVALVASATASGTTFGVIILIGAMASWILARLVARRVRREP